MKKFGAIIIIIAVLAVVAFGIISSGALDSCAPKKEQTQTPSIEPSTPSSAVSSDFTLGLCDGEGFLMDLTLSGNIYADFVPKNITFTAFGKEQAVILKEVMRYNDGYVFSFSEKVSGPGLLNKGESYNAQLNIEDEFGKVHKLTTRFISNDDYEYINVLSLETGKTSSGYDKVSVWIGPY